MEMFNATKKPYAAVMKEEWKNVAEEFKDDEVKLTFPMTSNRDTVLHLAVYSGESEPTRTFLARKLEIEEEFWKNNVGNTPLHEAATVGNLDAVKLLVEFRGEDLLEKNFDGETPLYRAVKYGQFEIVEYILDECEDVFARSSLNWTAQMDDTPIIHTAIQSENFEMVLKLVDFDKSLLEMKDLNGQTGLYVLANMPHVFHTENNMKFRDRIVYSVLPRGEDIYRFKFSNFWSLDNYDFKSCRTKNNEDLETGFNSKSSRRSNCWLQFRRVLKSLFWRFIFLGWPQWRNLYKERQKYEQVLRITKMLAEIDHSWFQSMQKRENTRVLSVNRVREPRDKKLVEDEDVKYEDHHETSLLLAAAKGILEVVTMIVEAHPQAIDYVTTQHRNILHVAIAHRQQNIFDWIRDRPIIMSKLAKRIDAMGFNVLHQVGITKFVQQATHGPALQLQQELMWFERVSNATPTNYKMHHSNSDWKPYEFFIETHNQMLENGKEWLKKTSESCSAVAVLIATVVFAAAFTVPGGLNSKTGSPVLLYEPIYMVFTVMDIIALTTSLASVVMFLSILTSSFRLSEFRHILPIKLSLGFQFLFFSVASTMMAFTLAVVLTMKSSEMKWAESILYLATFFPVTMFILIQLPLYVKLVKNLWSYRDSLLDFIPMGFLTLFFKVPSKFLRKNLLDFHAWTRRLLCRWILFWYSKFYEFIFGV